MKIRLALVLLASLLAADLAMLVVRADWWIVPGALLGWYLADMMSGAVHMYMDYKPCRTGIGLDTIYFYEGSRESEDYIRLRDATFAQLGPFERLVFDFKNHHPRPDALGRRNIVRLIGSTVLFATLPAALLLTLACLLLPLPAGVIAAGITFVLGTTFAQYFHGALHRTDVPWIVRALRATRLVMRPQDHAHHHATLTCDFSTNNGWSNPLLNRVFAWLQRTGRMPPHGLEPERA
ncbi:fatty acid desaturase CarF family protein [Sphingomonas montana]|uniref:fatty acid desaturase CarF family protein n=1 Tax=Sphingomonas montana TaxID=1843236 RepID=UPI00096D055D|nr:fatty acid desaturase CarF family protein [Sphingomonas montana]